MRRNCPPIRPILVFAALIMLSACGDARPPLFSPPNAGELSRDADPARGRQLMAERGCLACHAARGVSGPASRVGPLLDNLGRQAYLAGVLPNTRPNLVRWLLDPPAINPRTAMPNVGLKAAEAEDIAAFLLSRGDTAEMTP